MLYDHILLDLHPPLALLTLNRPDVLNALNTELLTEVDLAMHDLVDNPDIRVILLTGAGNKAFAAGADIREIAQLNAADGQALALRGQAVLRFFETCGKPVLACINGFALGGGCELAMACTLRLAADTARLGQPEVKLGLLPGYGGSQRLPRLTSRGAALKLLLTGEMIPAQEALRIGLVDEVLPAAELMPRAEALAHQIAANAPLALADTLRAVDEGLDLPIDLALMRESVRFSHLCATADKAEGTAAFLEKRTPTWQGK
jgi:enoyl-CoA hydratase